MHEDSFGVVIEEHLELMRRNGRLEAAMPIAGYLELVAFEETDVAIGSRSVAADDSPTETLVRGTQHWADPDSWWDVGEAGVGWAS